jgi:hypothetical protein
MKHAMKNLHTLLFVLCITGFFISCQKDHSNPADNNGAITYDTAATVFFNSAQITDTTVKRAINTFVVQLKTDSLWNKFLAIYPMVGGTASSTKWNLKDPRDVNAAFRISWNGAPACKNTGVTCLTLNDWGDTHLVDTLLSYNNASMSFYSETANQIAGYDMGCSNGIYPYNIIAIYEDFNKDIANTLFNAYGSAQYQPSKTTGLFITSSKDGKVVRYDNGVSVADYGSPHEAYTHTAITIGRVTDDDNMGQRECALATIGQGLTASQSQTFYNIVQTFQTTLGRQK